MIYTLTNSTVFGQLTSKGLQLSKVQEEMIQKTSEFDSVVLVDKTSFWRDDKQINGFGFKGNEIYKMKIVFSKDTSAFYGLTIAKIKKNSVKDKSKQEAIKEINYTSITTYSDDSLNLKSRTTSHLDISDSDDWTILVIRKNILILRQSYAPEIYQKLAPTKQREIFMDTLIKIDALLQ
jgi:hypothetical protein